MVKLCWENLKKIIKIIIGKTDVITFTGNYSTRNEAAKCCEGYDSDKIFEKVKKSILKVKNGEAAYERDGVLFEEKEYNFPLMTYLLMASCNKKIRVIDWGGSLGSTYFQNRSILGNDYDVKWCVIEQSHFVEFGIENLESEELIFKKKITDIKELEEYNVVLLSSVLQYLDSEMQVLEEICTKRPEYIIIERTPFGKERICIQKIREPIYDASYVCKILDEKKIISFIEKNGYQLIDQWNSIQDGVIYFENDVVYDKSLVFRRKS
ncbi:MAG: methyltransferase, TIGR04325 family [Lachnospiraceae bacterium]|nr:methyltransferase, TIGR04325 family [Lachnospiraceae bacterium]